MLYLVKSQSKRKVEEIMFDHMHENMQESYLRQFVSGIFNRGTQLTKDQISYRKKEICMKNAFNIIYVISMALLFVPALLLLFIHLSI